MELCVCVCVRGLSKHYHHDFNCLLLNKYVQSLRSSETDQDREDRDRLETERTGPWTGFTSKVCVFHIAVKFCMASVAVCSSMLSSWHNFSRTVRTELSSILLDSESSDSSSRIGSFTFGRQRQRKPDKTTITNTINSSPGLKPPPTPDTLPPTAPSHNATGWRENCGREAKGSQPFKIKSCKYGEREKQKRRDLHKKMLIFSLYRYIYVNNNTTDG